MIFFETCIITLITACMTTTASLPACLQKISSLEMMKVSAQLIGVRVRADPNCRELIKAMQFPQWVPRLHAQYGGLYSGLYSGLYIDNPWLYRGLDHGSFNSNVDHGNTEPNMAMAMLALVWPWQCWPWYDHGVTDAGTSPLGILSA